MLNCYPIELWKGEKVHRIKENILHLMRGQVFIIDEIKIFTMEGAISIDKEFRVLGRTWWYEEDLSKSEVDEAIANLNVYNGNKC